MVIDEHQAHVKLIQSETEGVSQYVNALSPEALETPSPCDQWNVGEVIAHLIWIAESYGGMVQRGLRGDQSPTDGFPASGTLGGPAIQAMYGQAAVDRRRSLGTNLIGAFNETYEWLNDLLERIGPEEWDKPCYHTVSPRPVHWFLPIYHQELAIHDWDIRSPFEPSHNFSENTLLALMERIPTMRRPWTIPFGTAFPEPKCYRFDLKGITDRRDIIVEGDKARMEKSWDGPVALTIAGHADAFVLLMYGRLSLDSSITQGIFKATGSFDLIPAFDDWLESH